MAKQEVSRVAESRNANNREQELRSIMDMSYQDPLYIPPEIIPVGWEYYWVRESCKGEGDSGRMVEMRRKGWMPVPADRHPEMVFDDFFGRLNHVQGMIYQKGLILCERPKEHGEVERKMIEEKNFQIMTSMPGTENFMGNPTMPGHVQNETYTSKGGSFGR